MYSRPCQFVCGPCFSAIFFYFSRHVLLVVMRLASGGESRLAASPRISCISLCYGHAALACGAMAYVQPSEDRICSLPFFRYYHCNMAAILSAPSFKGYVNSLLKEWAVPEVSVSLVTRGLNGTEEAQAHFGELADGRKPTDESLFNIGSVSK